MLYSFPLYDPYLSTLYFALPFFLLFQTIFFFLLFLLCSTILCSTLLYSTLPFPSRSVRLLPCSLQSFSTTLYFMLYHYHFILFRNLTGLLCILFLLVPFSFSFLPYFLILLSLLSWLFSTVLFSTQFDFYLFLNSHPIPSHPISSSTSTMTSLFILSGEFIGWGVDVMMTMISTATKNVGTGTVEVIYCIVLCCVLLCCITLHNKLIIILMLISMLISILKSMLELKSKLNVLHQKLYTLIYSIIM